MGAHHAGGVRGAEEKPPRPHYVHLLHVGDDVGGAGIHASRAPPLPRKWHHACLSGFRSCPSGNATHRCLVDNDGDNVWHQTKQNRATVCSNPGPEDSLRRRGCRREDAFIDEGQATKDHIAVGLVQMPSSGLLEDLRQAWTPRNPGLPELKNFSKVLVSLVLVKLKLKKTGTKTATTTWPVNFFFPFLFLRYVWYCHSQT